MMFQLSYQGGRRQNEIFIIHSNFSLTHRWTQKGVFHAQSIFDNNVREISVIKLDETYLIFGINGDNQLFCLKRRYLGCDYRWENDITIIEDKAGSILKLIVIEEQSSFYLYSSHQNGYIVLMVISKECLKQELRCVISQESKQKKDVKIVKINQKFHLISYLQNQDIKEIIFGLISINNTSKIQWTHKEAQISAISLIKVVNQDSIVMIAQDFDRNILRIQFTVPIFQLKQNKIIDKDQNYMKCNEKIALIIKKNQQYVYIAYNQGEIWKVDAKSALKCMIYNAGQRIINFCVFHEDTEDSIYFLNEKQIMMCLKGQNGKWSKSQSKQILIWQQVANSFEPIGDPGWHADAFFSKELEIVAKMMRIQSSYQVNDEIRILDYLSHYTNVRCLHQIYYKKVLRGLTMNFIPGIKWDTILSQENNLFFRSPIARVQFVCKLTNAIKILQQNRFCHGDLHLSNILIDIKSFDIINPQFSIQVIDYGNGFIFKDGELVTEGMTGLEIIVPFQAESINKKNFDPIGINAYQLGRNILQILLLSKHCQVGKLEYYATKELVQLKAKSQYPTELYEFVNGLLQEDRRERNVWLFKDIKHLAQKTRIIFLQSENKIQ